MAERNVATSLQQLIHIDQNTVRSIRLEDDFKQVEALPNYVLTAQGLASLERVFTGLTNQGTKAWTLTGPYGSGKSFFGLFLGRLLNGASSSRRTLAAVHPALAENIEAWLASTRGLLTIPITGARASLQTCLVRGFEKVLQRLEAPFSALLLQDLQAIKDGDSRLLLGWLERFLKKIRASEIGYIGALVIFDEMGKALEYAGAHPQESDIYLLQELAEFANRSGETPFAFIGILHQAFEQYAILLDTATQREWAKVQGRFEDIPFQEPPIQQMRLLARARESVDLPLAITEQITAACQLADAANWRPAMMPPDEVASLSQSVYPLHPTTFVALPYFFRRLGQNERSIFTYLTSQEPFGFQEFLAQNELGAFIRLPDLFDYLTANYQGRIYASGRARPLAEALERLANTPNLSATETALLKTIGLLNWLSEISPLQATEERILSALSDGSQTEAELRAGLKILQKRSLIVYRRFNETYVIWQGSDVDIEERLQMAYAAQAGTFSLAEILQAYLPPRPLIARRHSYQTGTLRYLDVRYADAHNRDKVSLAPQEPANGVVLLCLPATLAEIEQFAQWAYTLSECENLVIGIAGRAIRLRELVQELRGLHWVRENTPELRDDQVARRELRSRLAAIESLIRSELDEALNLHQIAALTSCQWIQGGQDVSPRARRGLSFLLSEICDSLYPASPRIWNELLNRRELTSQGAAARRTLIEDILTRTEQPLLGIQGFPPERSMYESLLRRGEMHRLDGERWYIASPGENELNLRPAWQAIYDFVFAPLPEPRSLTLLYDRLTAPPFGMTQGVIPVLLAVFYKVYENEVTLYREGTLLAAPSVADWEVLLRRPELFALAGCRVAGLRAAVVERMARGLRVPPYVMPVTRAVIGRLKALPEYAWRTRRLPEVALNLRRAVEITRSPEHFLFVEVPEALGLLAFAEGEFDQERFDAFFERLNTALDALNNALPQLLIWARDTWLTACGLPGGEEGWEDFRRQAAQLALRVTHPALLPLLKRAADATDSRAALESVLALIANRPARMWTDADTERFAAQARHMGGIWQAHANDDQPVVPLVPDETQQRAEVIIRELEPFLSRLYEEPEAVNLALRLLLKRWTR